jgi:two-component system, cell cycle sensor histidine kinase and response regulator CckA
MAVGALWIWGSDWLVAFLASGSAEAVDFLQSAKGTAFVAATGVALYLGTSAVHRRLDRYSAEKRVLAEHLAVSQRLEALGTLTGTVAHDFNNMIMIIRGAAEMARLEAEYPGVRQHHLETIERAANQADQMVRQMMQFMRAMPAVYRAERLDDVVYEVLPILRQAAGRQVQVDLRAGSDLPPVRFDRSQVERTLLNLVVNARDASVDAAEKCIVIEVAARRLQQHVSRFRSEPATGSFVALSVGDSGCGIPRENLDRIFTPFFTTKAKERGNGLGLTSVANVMQLHGGWVEVESTPGQGSVFTLLFPAAPVDSAPSFERQTELVHA